MLKKQEASRCDSKRNRTKKRGLWPGYAVHRWPKCTVPDCLHSCEVPTSYTYDCAAVVDLISSLPPFRCLGAGGVGGRLLPDAKVLRDDGSRVASGNIRGVLSQPHPTICVSGWPPTRAPKWAIDPGPEDPCRIGGSYLLGAKLGRSA